MVTRYLSREFLTEFIKIYETFPCLWKIKSKEYVNKNLKENAYEQLLQFCKKTYPEADIKFVKNKIQSIRNSFRKELRKVYSSRRSGAGTEDVYEPILWYYKLLLFTKDQEMPDESVENIERGEAESSKLSEDLLETDEEPPTPVPQLPTQENSPIIIKQTAKKRKQHLEEKFFTTCLQALNNDEKMVKCDIVGKNIAAKLRRMDYHQKILAESLIQQILTKGLFKELSRNTMVVEQHPPVHSPYSFPSTSHSSTPLPSPADECSENSSSNVLTHFYENVTSEL